VPLHLVHWEREGLPSQEEQILIPSPVEILRTCPSSETLGALAVFSKRGCTFTRTACPIAKTCE